jgi:flagellar basal-body rod protein FlgB
MNSPTLLSPALENFLSLTSAREQTIAGNMANVDTPGYQTRDVNFRQSLMTASFTGDDAQLMPVVNKVQGLMERPDGNNVDMDRESTLLAQTQLQYQLGAQLIKSNFHQLMAAINGGQ